MLHKKTVFIIGAGSGFDINMPLGTDLANSIAKTTDIRSDANGKPIGSDAVFREIIRRLAQERSANQWPTEANRLNHVCRQISEGINLANSIDDYVNIHQTNTDLVECSKLAICFSIMNAERRSKIYVNTDRSEQHKFNTLKDIWYSDLFKTISHSVTLENKRSLFNNISFINFNYDRCLEYYLINAIQKLYVCSVQEAISIVQTVAIYHPYGQIGSLPGFSGPAKTVKFGGDEYEKYQALALTDEIYTYTEKLRDYSAVDLMRQKIFEADQLIFLGFGFHAQNMRLITPVSMSTMSQKFIYGTALGISDQNAQEIINNLVPLTATMDRARVNLQRNFGCSELLSNFDMPIRRIN